MAFKDDRFAESPHHVFKESPHHVRMQDLSESLQATRTLGDVHGSGTSVHLKVPTGITVHWNDATHWHLQWSEASANESGFQIESQYYWSGVWWQYSTEHPPNGWWDAAADAVEKTGESVDPTSTNRFRIRAVYKDTGPAIVFYSDYSSWLELPHY